MRVPARLYADEELLEASLLDRSIEQLVNTATLPGVVKYAIAMPDIRSGSVATDSPDIWSRGNRTGRLAEMTSRSTSWRITNTSTMPAITFFAMTCATSATVVRRTVGLR